MSLLARATATKRVSISEDGTFAVGPSLEAIQTAYPWFAGDASAIQGLGIVTVYACVRVLAETIASLPLVLYRSLAGGGKERATDHPLYETFHDQPNPDMTSLVWRELLVSHVAGWGNGYSEIVEDGLGRLQFWPLNPSRMEVGYDDRGRKAYDYITSGGSKKRLDPSKVLHVPGLSPDGLKGYSPIALHRKALRLSAVAQEYGTNFLDNNARPAVVLTHPKTLSTPAIDRLAAQMDALRGSKNAGKTVILEEGLSITEVGIAPEDAQYIETRKFQMQEIARMYRVPPHMIGDLERATFSNIEHQSIDFVVHTIRPWLVRIEQAIKSQVLREEPDLSVEFLIDGLLRGDAESRAKALAIRRQNGTINGNEWRALENENPIPDGSGEVYWMPVNYTIASVPEDVAAVPEEEPTSPPVLRAVKSGEVRCPSCNRKLAELAAPPYKITCGRCKAVAEADGEPVEATKSADDRLDATLIDLPSRIAAALPRQEKPEVHFHEGAFKAGDITVQPATIERGAFEVNVAAPPAAKAPIVNLTVPPPTRTVKHLAHDADGNLTTITEEPA